MFATTTLAKKSFKSQKRIKRILDFYYGRAYTCLSKTKQKRGNEMKISTKAKCVECSRVFDLLNDNDAQEWAYGHDCEVE